ncbi:MAG: diacylglycerol kinase family protein [Pirellula sp.]
MIPNTPSALVIANPTAGRGRFRQRCLEQSEIAREWVWKETEFPGHAEELAAEAGRAGAGLVVAAGGDGTIHEVLNGLLRNPDNQTVLGILPVGTANDYVMAFRDHAKDRSTPRCVDVGLLQWDDGSRYFVNAAGIGLPGAIADQSRRLRRYPARLRYTLSLALSLGSSFRPAQASMMIDEIAMPPTNLLMLSIGIGTHVGSFPLHPAANLEDGELDVLEVGDVGRIELARFVPGLLRGSIPTNHPKVRTHRCRSLGIRASHPLCVHLDGEQPTGLTKSGEVEYTVQVIPTGINMMLIDPGVGQY